MTTHNNQVQQAPGARNTPALTGRSVMAPATPIREVPICRADCRHFREISAARYGREDVDLTNSRTGSRPRS